MGDVLVTGATGFVGSHLVEGLHRAGRRVVCLVRPGRDTRHLDGRGIRVHRGDLLDARSLEGCCDDVELVYHLGGSAALRTGDPRALGVNSRGTRNLLDVAVTTGRLGRFVFVSSMAAVSPGRGRRLSRRLDDGASGEPDTLYGRSKREAEREVETRCVQAGIPYVILRPALIYGAGNRPEGGMNTLVRIVEAGGMLGRLDLPGEISVVHVKDFVRLCLAAAEHPEVVNRTFLVSDGTPVTFGDVFRALGHLLGRPAARHRVPVPICAGARVGYDLLDRWFQVSRWVPSYVLGPIATSMACDGGRLKRLLEFEPEYSLQAGLAECLGVRAACAGSNA